MPDDVVEPDDLDEDQSQSPWDAADVMRARAEASRALRDDAIGELRESMTDAEIREDFGIDLRELGR